MTENQLPGGILYTGTPTDVLMAIAQRIIKALEQANITPTGLHVLAMLHVLSCALHNGRHDYAEGDTSLGMMPTFKTVLTLMTRVSMGEKLSSEETQAFNEDFVAIVKSLGGSIERAGTQNQLPTNGAIIAPMSSEIH